ncbi:unnamed protein product, partial [Prorocentrum cordatum]
APVGGVPRILHRVFFLEGGWCSPSFKSIRATFHESNPGWEEWIWGMDEVIELFRQEGAAIDQLLGTTSCINKNCSQLGSFSDYFMHL